MSTDMQNESFERKSDNNTSYRRIRQQVKESMTTNQAVTLNVSQNNEKYYQRDRKETNTLSSNPLVTLYVKVDNKQQPSIGQASTIVSASQLANKRNSYPFSTIPIEDNQRQEEQSNTFGAQKKGYLYNMPAGSGQALLQTLSGGLLSSAKSGVHALNSTQKFSEYKSEHSNFHDDPAVPRIIHQSEVSPHVVCQFSLHKKNQSSLGFAEADMDEGSRASSSLQKIMSPHSEVSRKNEQQVISPDSLNRRYTMEPKQQAIGVLHKTSQFNSPFSEHSQNSKVDNNGLSGTNLNMKFQQQVHLPKSLSKVDQAEIEKILKENNISPLKESDLKVSQYTNNKPNTSGFKLKNDFNFAFEDKDDEEDDYDIKGILPERLEQSRISNNQTPNILLDGHSQMSHSNLQHVLQQMTASFDEEQKSRQQRELQNVGSTSLNTKLIMAQANNNIKIFNNSLESAFASSGSTLNQRFLNFGESSNLQESSKNGSEKMMKLDILKKKIQDKELIAIPEQHQNGAKIIPPRPPSSGKIRQKSKKSQNKSKNRSLRSDSNVSFKSSKKASAISINSQEQKDQGHKKLEVKRQISKSKIKNNNDLMNHLKSNCSSKLITKLSSEVSKPLQAQDQPIHKLNQFVKAIKRQNTTRSKSKSVKKAGNLTSKHEEEEIQNFGKIQMKIDKKQLGSVIRQIQVHTKNNQKALDDKLPKSKSRSKSKEKHLYVQRENFESMTNQPKIRQNSSERRKKNAIVLSDIRTHHHETITQPQVQRVEQNISFKVNPRENHGFPNQSISGSEKELGYKYYNRFNYQKVGINQSTNNFTLQPNSQRSAGDLFTQVNSKARNSIDETLPIQVTSVQVFNNHNFSSAEYSQRSDIQNERIPSLKSKFTNQQLQEKVSVVKHCQQDLMTPPENKESEDQIKETIFTFEAGQGKKREEEVTVKPAIFELQQPFQPSQASANSSFQAESETIFNTSKDANIQPEKLDLSQTKVERGVQLDIQKVFKSNESHLTLDEMMRLKDRRTPSPDQIHTVSVQSKPEQEQQNVQETQLQDNAYITNATSEHLQSQNQSLSNNYETNHAETTKQIQMSQHQNQVKRSFEYTFANTSARILKQQQIMKQNHFSSQRTLPNSYFSQRIPCSSQEQRSTQKQTANLQKQSIQKQYATASTMREKHELGQSKAPQFHSNINGLHKQIAQTKHFSSVNTSTRSQPMFMVKNQTERQAFQSQLNNSVEVPHQYASQAILANQYSSQNRSLDQQSLSINNRSLDKSGFDFINEAKDFQVIIGGLKDLLIRGSSNQSRSKLPSHFRSVETNHQYQSVRDLNNYSNIILKHQALNNESSEDLHTKNGSFDQYLNQRNSTTEVKETAVDKSKQLQEYMKRKLEMEDLRKREFDRKLQRDIITIESVITTKYQNRLPQQPQSRCGQALALLESQQQKNQPQSLKRSFSTVQQQSNSHFQERKSKHIHQMTFGGDQRSNNQIQSPQQQIIMNSTLSTGHEHTLDHAMPYNEHHLQNLNEESFVNTDESRSQSQSRSRGHSRQRAKHFNNLHHGSDEENGVVCLHIDKAILREQMGITAQSNPLTKTQGTRKHSNYRMGFNDIQEQHLNEPQNTEDLLQSIKQAEAQLLGLKSDTCQLETEIKQLKKIRLTNNS